MNSFIIWTTQTRSIHMALMWAVAHFSPRELRQVKIWYSSLSLSSSLLSKPRLALSSKLLELWPKFHFWYMSTITHSWIDQGLGDHFHLTMIFLYPTTTTPPNVGCFIQFSDICLLWCLRLWIHQPPSQTQLLIAPAFIHPKIHLFLFFYLFIFYLKARVLLIPQNVRNQLNNKRVQLKN